MREKGTRNKERWGKRWARGVERDGEMGGKIEERRGIGRREGKGQDLGKRGGRDVEVTGCGEVTGWVEKKRWERWGVR